MTFSKVFLNEPAGGWCVERHALTAHSTRSQTPLVVRNQFCLRIKGDDSIETKFEAESGGMSH